MKFVIYDETPIPGMSGETQGKIGVTESREEAEEFRRDYIESMDIAKKDQKYILIEEE